jgi:uncharacterized protein with von Willebrand factor type A (vWA) domain
VKWLLLLTLLGCCACETDEVKAWTARRVELEARRTELLEREAVGGSLEERKARMDRFRADLALAALARERKIAARVFVEPGLMRITVSQSIEQCHEALMALADVRWLISQWKLRLEAGHCEWEGRTDTDYATLEQALVASPTSWTPPPHSVFSSGLVSLKKSVQGLEADLRAQEVRLGEVAMLEGRLAKVQPLVDSLRARSAPCDLFVLERELALDADQQGKLLEVERTRLVHPLEPRGDFRLRGLVEVFDGSLVWHCEAR